MKDTLYIYNRKNIRLAVVLLCAVMLTAFFALPVSSESYLQYYSNNMAEPLAYRNVTINMASTMAESDNALFLPLKAYEEKNNVLVWNNQRGEITYQFTTVMSGNYAIAIEFMPLVPSGSAENITLGIKLDGEYPFAEASAMILPRAWKDERAVYKDELDNDVLPMQVGQSEWRTSSLRSFSGYYDEPYHFFIPEGVHTLTLVADGPNIAISKIKLTNVTPPIFYIEPNDTDLYKTPDIAVPNEYGDYNIRVEAEAPISKSDPLLVGTYNKSAQHISPSHPTKKRINTIGSDWNTNGQSLTYEFGISQSGYYRFAFKVKQDSALGLPSYRRFYIDGETPFAELMAQSFQPQNDWYKKTLTTATGEDIYIYLEQGKHTLAIEAVGGDKGDILRNIALFVDELNDESDLQAACIELRGYIEQLRALSKGNVAELAYLEKCIAKGDLSAILAAADDVYRWLQKAMQNPLELDFFEIMTVHQPTPPIEGNLFSEMGYKFQMFLGSFFTETVAADSKPLDVMVNLSQNDSAIIGTLARQAARNDPDFVKVDIDITSCSLTEVIMSGRAPDVYLYADNHEIAPLAQKGLLTDITQFQTYYTVTMEHFSDEVLSLYSHDGKVYGLPITIDMPALFYRKDFFEGDFTLPKTWDELHSTASSLANVHKSVGLYPTSTILSAEGMLEIMLAQGRESDKAFDDILALYNNSTEASVIDFVSGIQPLVIADYSVFSNALTAHGKAIEGQWGFTLLPGTVRGINIDRSSPLRSLGAVIPDNTKKLDSAWQFISWLTSSETQQSLYGQKYLTANYHAYQALPYSYSRTMGLTLLSRNLTAYEFSLDDDIRHQYENALYTALGD